MDEDKLRVLRALREPTARRAEATLGALKHEIMAEMAASFARANEKVARLHAAFLEADRLATESPSPAHTAERAEARAAAAEALWELAVHRESIGFRDHDELATRWPLPSR